MSKRGLTIVVLLIVAVIIAVIVVDFLNNRPDKMGKNPYAYNVDEYRAVDPSLIHYKETRNISMGNRTCTGIDFFKQDLFIVGDNFLQVISKDGKQKFFNETGDKATCVKVAENRIYVGFESHIEVFDLNGEHLASWEDLGDRCVITSIAIKDDNVYVADAGNRRILIFNKSGQLKQEFEGGSTSEAGHGFIIPSPNFDVVVNNFGELWVVNPGKHAIENYSDDGELRGYWQSSAMTIEGFTGCCNPAEIAVTDEGDFVTSEKGLVRIKIYNPSGELKSVVAPPDKFKEEGKAPEIVVDHQGNVYALDFDKMMIRIFEPIEL